MYIFKKNEHVNKKNHITEVEQRQLTHGLIKSHLFILSINWGVGTLS